METKLLKKMREREREKKRGQTRLALTKYIISFTKAARVRPY